MATLLMAGAPKQLAILLGNKLVGLDSILPVAMELKAEVPHLRIKFVFLNAATLSIVEQNYVLHRGIMATGEITVLARGQNIVLRKITAGARLVRLALSIWLQPSLLLSPGDLGIFPFNLFARAARLGGGSACTYCKPAYPGNPALNHAHGLKTSGRDMRWRDSGDAFLIYHPVQSKDYDGYAVAPPALLGTPRDFPAWRRFLGVLAAEDGIRDENGADIAKFQRPLFVVFYPGAAIIPHQVDNVRDSFLAVLGAIAEYAPEASIIIKPHPICDLNLLRRDLSERPEVNIQISHAHPQLLLSLATIAIATNGSNVIYDCFLEGIPVIETTRYRDDILALGNSLYPNPGRIDGSDPAKLRAAIRAAVVAPETLPKPDRTGLTWLKPAVLGPVLWIA